MDLKLLNELQVNINNTKDELIKEQFLKNLIDELNEKMKELNDVLLDINTNNIHNLQSKQRDLFIENESMKPFIKYLIVYNTFLNKIY